MRIGLIIGKFLPVHLGHLALIDFASGQCDRLIVSMSYTLNDQINKDLRFDWLKRCVSELSNIEVKMVLDNFDDGSLDLNERTRIWAAFIKKQFPEVTILFSSEEYGDMLSVHLQIPHILFDQKREQFPVSATLIRNNPMRYWKFIPGPVRSYFVKKVCLYGPESTGKSYMIEMLANEYNTLFVPEVAREVLSDNNFDVNDIIKIGNLHYQRIITSSEKANRILFCDTDAITTQIYSYHYLKTIPPVLFELEKKIVYDHYFLFDIDVPWVEDGMRDLGNQRKEMFQVFKNALDQRKITYTLVKGNWDDRKAIVKNVIDQLLSE